MTLKFLDNELILNNSEWKISPFRFTDILKIGGQGSTPTYIDVILSGINSLSLASAKANGLNYVKLFGGTEQTGTPTPDNKIDVKCNNGLIKYSLNLANYTENNITLGYWIRNNNGQPEGSPANFYTDLMPVLPNTSYIAYGRTKDGNILSNYNRIAFYDENQNWISNSTYTSNTIGKATSPNNAKYARFHCNPTGSDVTMDIINNFNWVFQQGTVEVDYRPFNQMYTDGTVETVKDSLNNSAIAEMLLSVGDVKDVQSVLNGEVTRNIGILILDGTESWQVATGTGFKQFYSTNTQGIIANSVSLMSTIAPYGCTASTRANYNYGCYSGGNGNLCFQMIGSSTINTVQNWTDYLLEQYQHRTPVVVIYPKSTPTTETVTAQTLTTQAGANTIQITQSSVNNLALEASYKKVV